MKLTAIIEPEGDSFVSLCPELDIASQGDTEQEARANLKEALELFFECAPEEEVQRRLRENAISPPVLASVAEDQGEYRRNSATPLEIEVG